MARATEFTAVALNSRGILATALRTGTVDELVLQVAVADLPAPTPLFGFIETVTLADWWEKAMKSGGGHGQPGTVTLDDIWRDSSSAERRQVLVAFFSHIIDDVAYVSNTVESTAFHGYDIRHLAWDGSGMEEADAVDVLTSLLHLDTEYQTLLGVVGGGDLHDLLAALHTPAA